MSVFVTGTDTGIGKTMTCGCLMKAFAERPEIKYYKPVQTGSDNDRDEVLKMSGLPNQRALPFEFHFSEPLSPHRACELDGCEPVELEYLVHRFKEHSRSAELIVEGAGGLFVPLNRQRTWLDYLQHTGLSVVLVTRTTLGTINHTLLSIEALLSRSIEIAGIVFSGPENEDNRKTILEFYDRMSMSHKPLLVTQFDLEKGCISNTEAQKLLPLLGG